MSVTLESLRRSYSTKSAEELRHIAGSAPGEYTPEAVLAAQEVLASLPPAPDEAAGADAADAAASPTKGADWGGIGAALVALYASKQLFYVWWAADKNPAASSSALHPVIGSPWTYVLIAVLAVSLWRERRAG